LPYYAFYQPRVFAPERLAVQIAELNYAHLTPKPVGFYGMARDYEPIVVAPHEQSKKRQTRAYSQCYPQKKHYKTFASNL